MTKVSIILEKAGGTTNCYDGNIWDNSFCPDPATCNANCEMGNHFNNKIHRNKKFLARTLTFVINFIRKTGGQGGPGGPGGQLV